MKRGYFHAYVQETTLYQMCPRLEVGVIISGTVNSAKSEFCVVC